MPRLTVPLIHPAHAESVTLSYRAVGTGPNAVLLLPGLCVPSSMYNALAAILSSTPAFTAITLDNRGIGRSDTPTARLFHAPGYTARNLARDAWAVVDAVSAARALRPSIAVVGHSMGGMIAQQMLCLRPRRVRFVALLATHAGRFTDLLPTAAMLAAASRLLWNRFHPRVSADVNLRLHFTPRFLDQLVPLPSLAAHHQVHPASDDLDQPDVIVAEPDTEIDTEPEPEQEPEPEPEQEPEQHVASPSNRTSRDSQSPPRRTPSGTDLRYLDSKVHEFSREAGVHFGLTSNHLTTTLRRPQRALLRAFRLRRRRRRPGQTEPDSQSQSQSHLQPHPQPQRLALQPLLSPTRRFDVYHAQYAGPDQQPSTAITEVPNAPSEAPGERAFHGLLGHAAVVWSHVLPDDVARQLRSCRRVGKLVIIGRHDRVVTPAASRRLARLIEADTVVEVDAAHFVADEVAAEVSTQILYGLRKAFLGQPVRCDCEWCSTAPEDDDDDEPATDLVSEAGEQESGGNASAWGLGNLSTCHIC